MQKYNINAKIIASSGLKRFYVGKENSSLFWKNNFSTSLCGENMTNFAKLYFTDGHDILLYTSYILWLDINGIAESFFISLGFEPLSDTFWERSLFIKPQDRNVVCHASAWNFFAPGGGDFRYAKIVVSLFLNFNIT